MCFSASAKSFSICCLSDIGLLTILKGSFSCYEYDAYSLLSLTWHVPTTFFVPLFIYLSIFYSKYFSWRVLTAGSYYQVDLWIILAIEVIFHSNPWNLFQDQLFINIRSFPPWDCLGCLCNRPLLFKRWGIHKFTTTSLYLVSTTPLFFQK